MRLSENGLNFIKSKEGLRLTSYKAVPTEKYYTIGYGHYGADVKAGQTITKEQAENLLRLDVQRFVDGVNNELRGTIVSQSQFDAMVSLAYNIGLGAFSSSTLLQKVREKNTTAAANEFLRWNKSGGNVLKGLTTRREEEKAMFLGSTPLVANRSGSTDLLADIKSKLQGLSDSELKQMAMVGIGAVIVAKILD